MADISKHDNVIDSQDVIARIDELESEREALEDAVTEAREALDAGVEIEDDQDETDRLAERARLKEALVNAASDLDEWDNDDDLGGELKTLRDFADEGEQNAEDWSHGATLINESYFTEYCQELVSDIGDLPKDIPGYLVIDWEATAHNLRADYSEITWDGENFLVR